VKVGVRVDVRRVAAGYLARREAAEKNMKGDKTWR